MTTRVLYSLESYPAHPAFQPVRIVSGIDLAAAAVFYGIGNDLALWCYMGGGSGTTFTVLILHISAQNLLQFEAGAGPHAIG